MKTRKNPFKLSVAGLVILTMIACERKDDPIPDKFTVAVSDKTDSPGSTIKYATLENEFILKSSPSGMLKSASMAQAELSCFWMAETELTYALWKEVYDWAHNNGYKFQTTIGQTGSDVGSPTNHPVTRVCWLSSLAWANALTEYYNMFNGDKPDYSLAYFYEDSPYRNAIWSEVEDEKITYNKGASGFRIPTNDEWYSAAAYQGTSDDCACGAKYSYEHEGATGLVAWYRNNSDMKTHPVAQKLPNKLGLYDMSGNASEIVFDKLGFDATHHNYRGGAYNSNPDRLAIGWHAPIDPHTNSRSIGFRIARTIGGDDHVEIQTIEDENTSGTIQPGNGNGSFTFNDNTCPITNALLFNYNAIGSPMLELELFSDGISPNPENSGGYTGTGNYMEIQIFTTHQNLADKHTYTSVKNPSSTIFAAPNCNTDVFPFEYTESFLAGENVNISIAIADDIYTITISASGLEIPSGTEGNISAIYTGELTVLQAGTDF